MHWSFWVAQLAQVALAASSPDPIGIHLESGVDSHIVNIGLKYRRSGIDEHVFTYGPCDSQNPKDAHHTIARAASGAGLDDNSRLAWVIPEDAPSGQCISAWDGSKKLLGRSQPLSLSEARRRRAVKRDNIAMNNESGIDAEGPWFNGVELLKNKEIGVVDVKKAKSKSIGIVGAGISGLMTYYLLNSVGFNNIHISESSGRVGGRIRTEYFEEPASKYRYQEMGAMRIPLTAHFPLGPNETITLNFNAHDIVFQLGKTLNELNKHDETLSIDWIPFIQLNNNSRSLIGNKRLPDGSIPTIEDVANDPSLGAPTIHTPLLDKLTQQLNEVNYNPENMKLIEKNIYEAHKKFLDGGVHGMEGDTWGQEAFILNYLGYDLNTTDLAGGIGLPNVPFWVNLYDNLFFSSSDWLTIDKGMNRLPNAFLPLVGNNLHYYQKIQEVEYCEGTEKVTLSWKNHYTDCHTQKAEFDHVFISAPFTVVRKMKLPEFSTTLSHAIKGLTYTSACKVALEFKSRFWEHIDRPIFGGCNTVTDIPGLGDVCYPSFNMNSSGPAVILGSYNKDDYGQRWVSTPEDEHAAYVLDGIVKLHGEVTREQYTGNFKRLCWLEEEGNAGGSWAFPSVGQHQLYIPAYFKTENNIIFIGEHTSYTHSWISSALESSVRGTVQLLLGLGLVDEAKQITKTWMGRWIDV